MNIEDTNQLLIRIQVIDNRQIGDSTVLAWHELVEDLELAPALEAVRLHFRESREYLTPAHVRAGIERIRVAGLGQQQDEWGNDIAPDLPAVAAFQRLHATQSEIES